MLAPPIHSSTHQCLPLSAYLHFPPVSGSGVPKNQTNREGALLLGSPCPAATLVPQSGESGAPHRDPLAAQLAYSTAGSRSSPGVPASHGTAPGGACGCSRTEGPRAPPALPGVTAAIPAGAIPAGDTAGRKGLPAAEGAALSQPQARPRICPRERQGGVTGAPAPQGALGATGWV